MKFVLLVIGVMLGYAWAFQVYANQTAEFNGVPTDKLHTMRVYEDGSYNIEYQDGTSEIGCLNGGLCND